MCLPLRLLASALQATPPLPLPPTPASEDCPLLLHPFPFLTLFASTRYPARWHLQTSLPYYSPSSAIAAGLATHNPPSPLTW